MRIGTWNLAGRWSPEHERFLLDLDCDVLLLTEVSERLAMPGLHLHLGGQPMTAGRRWAAILSREPIAPLSDPHPASAMGEVDGRTVCCSVLPWVGCGDHYPYGGVGHAEMTTSAVTTLLPLLPARGAIWGGDWNQDLEGAVHTGSKGGRGAIATAVASLKLDVPTAGLESQVPRALTVDHIAVPDDVDVKTAYQASAVRDGRPLSDHDAYVVEI